MQLTVDSQCRYFTSLKQFRADYHLPAEFGVAYFEPKNWANLGSIEGAGSQLAAIRAQVIAAVPAVLTPPLLLPAISDIAGAFRLALHQQNTFIGLHPPEVEFAAAGFSDVLHAVAYRLVQTQYSHDSYNFGSVYQAWLDDSVRISTVEYRYSHNGEDFLVRLVNNIYGRVGLIVTVGGQTHYVQDTSQACPAASFMDDLCREVSDRLNAALH